MEESKAVEPIDLGKRKWKIHEFRIRCKGSTFKPQAANAMRAGSNELLCRPITSSNHFPFYGLQSAIFMIKQDST